MANIIEEILRAALNDEPSEEAAERIARKNMEEKRQDLDTDVTIFYHHKKGTDGAEIKAAGRGAAIIVGMCSLLGCVALRLAGNKKEGAMEIVDEVHEGARSYINERGYRRCVGLC